MRVKFLNPTDVVSMLPIQKGEAVADFGAGVGHFLPPLSRAVGETGSVYALDILPHNITVMRRQTKTAGLHNVHVIQGDLEHPGGSTLRDNAVQGVVAVNLLFQARDPKAVLREAARVIRPGGWCAVSDWTTHREAEGTAGPARQHLISASDVRAWAEQAGFVFEREFPAGVSHFGLLFRKP